MSFNKYPFIVFLFILFSASSLSTAQLLHDKDQFTRQDSLRGSITPERAWWDITYYNLDVTVLPEDKFIYGSNTITYKVLEPYQVMQIDLQEPMYITMVTQNGKELEVKHEGNAHFITLQENQTTGSKNQIKIDFEGHPREARNAPWDGGFSWRKDSNGKDFIATSNQGLGASVWWPCKDHMYQEVDGMTISVNAPAGLMNVSNGRLTGTELKPDGSSTYTWEVRNPINNYGVNINIGDYVNFSEVYQGEAGPLDMNYYVLRDNLDKAKKQFKDAPKMMKAFEHWFGPYPFYADSYKLVEVPYLGMEHQSSVTYGNRYVNGYLGSDLSGSGWGMKFDFIIIHESGHEWFANNITNKDIADMWIHESFTSYSENLFVDYYYGKEASAAYVIGTRRKVMNDKPLIGKYDVNNEGSGDMYYKGANFLHTLRQITNDDEKWRQILRGLNFEFYHKTVTTAQIENYISDQMEMDLNPVFNQYLRDTRIPKLEYSIKKRNLHYRWVDVVEGFEMPIQVLIDGEKTWITPTSKIQKMKLPSKKSEFEVIEDFYVKYKKRSKLS
ncbi:peptidase M1-like protein [Nonlabens xylanidelens]|uniref:Peptidase M1-like protein n=1 Tax=Nonlabens xylanidelens TaxID=191564 RepID=A0A2S6IPP1_9FLAO|nr:M1 family metallopeptidase [Nonlabens xylanidelens]PPK96224.1 peptidase M1-like protein [Nonlabens xylanidelens]PQJ17966.1 peptidase M1 [Nonlabens xylanidelens]